MTNYANSKIQVMKSYSPPLEGRRKFKGQLLDFNERTIPVSSKVKEALIELIKADNIQVYPEYGDLIEEIASYTGAKKEEVMITNGSDQGIDLIFRTFVEEGEEVVIPSPSFAMFSQCAQIVGAKVINSIKEGVKLIVICNPNNPTGETIDLKEIEEITKKALDMNAIVYIDEAYFEFSKVTAVSLINKYPNLIITRTFSKAFGLASLRIGYTISSEKNISEMMKVRGPYDISMPAVVAAKAALQDVKSMEKYVDEVMNESKPMLENFFRENNIEFYPSRANFILFRPRDSKEMTGKLKEQGFLTRPREGVNINGTVRVTIGTVKQMKEFINQFKNV